MALFCTIMGKYFKYLMKFSVVCVMLFFIFCKQDMLDSDWDSRQIDIITDLILDNESAAGPPPGSPPAPPPGSLPAPGSLKVVSKVYPDSELAGCLSIHTV